MILICINYFKEIFTKLGVKSIYTSPEEESKFKGSQYVSILEHENDQLVYDGSIIGKKDDLTTNKRTYYRRIYQVNSSIQIRIVAKDETTATKLKNDFLISIAKVIPDKDDCAIELFASTATLIQDKSILKSGAGYEIVIDCTGGIYKTRVVPLITEVVPEGEIAHDL